MPNPRTFLGTQRAGDIIQFPRGQPQDLADFAHGGARREGREGDDVRDPIGSNVLFDVCHQLIAAFVPNVQVEVRAWSWLSRHEALEQQTVFQGIDRGDSQHEADQAARRGAAARANGDALLLGVPHHVLNDEEAACQLSFFDHRQLVGEPVPHRDGQGLVTRNIVAVDGATFAFTPEFVGRLAARRRRILRRPLPSEPHFELALFGDDAGVRQCFGQIPEQLAHRDVALQEVLIGIHAWTRCVRQHLTAAHAAQDVVRLGIGFLEIAHIVRGDDRDVEPAGQAQSQRLDQHLVRGAVSLHLHVEPLASEDLAQASGHPFRTGGFPAGQSSGHRTVHAAVERQETRGKAGQILEVDHGFRAPALEIRPGQ